jgi:hypothetical protein
MKSKDDKANENAKSRLQEIKKTLNSIQIQNAKVQILPPLNVQLVPHPNTSFSLTQPVFKN